MDDFFLQLFLAINLVILGVVTTLTIQYWRRHLHPKKEEPSPKPKKESPLSPQDKDRMARELEKHFQDILNRSGNELEQDLQDVTSSLRERFVALSSNISSEELEQYQTTFEELQKEAKDTLGGLQQAVAQHQSELTAKLVERQGQLEAALGKRQAQLQTELNERQAELEANLLRRNTELQQEFKDKQAAFDSELSQQQARLRNDVLSRQSKLTEIQTAFDEDLAARRQVMEQRLNEELQGKRQALARELDSRLSDLVMSYILESLQHNVDLGAQGAYLTSMLDEHKQELRKELLG